jgi:hypothetical protein
MKTTEQQIEILEKERSEMMNYIGTARTVIENMLKTDPESSERVDALVEAEKLLAGKPPACTMFLRPAALLSGSDIKAHLRGGPFDGQEHTLSELAQILKIEGAMEGLAKYELKDVRGTDAYYEFNGFEN